LISLADSQKKPWDCSGFLAFLDLSIPDQLALLYHEFLARGIDQGGMDSYRRRILNGELTILGVRDSLVASGEFEEGVRKSVNSRLGHWHVWGGLKDVHSCLVQSPTHVEADGPYDQRIEPGAGSVFVSSLELISENQRIGAHLAGIALGSDADLDLVASWEADHSELVSALTQQVEARKAARKAKKTEVGRLQYNGLLGSMQVGDAGRATADGIRSRPGAKGNVFHGPYFRLSPGSYRLSLRLRCGKKRKGGRASISVEAIYNHSLMLGCLGIEESAFSRETHILEFEVPKAVGLSGPKFEFRLFTNGVAEIELFDLSLEHWTRDDEPKRAAGAGNWLPIMSVGSAGEATAEGVRSEAGVAGHVFYGPYRALLPGKYLLAVDYDGQIGEGGSLTLEAVDSDNQIVLASHELPVEAGASSLELSFAIQHPTSAGELPPSLEFRLFKTAGADVLIRAVRIEAALWASTGEGSTWPYGGQSPFPA
jgi:hypothetical protein